MASAVDSGVDTGNDSNDSSVQEKLFKMDLENSPQTYSKSSDLSKDTSSEKEKEDVNEPNTSAAILLKEPGPGMSLTHLQPSSLIHGFEYHPTHSEHRNINCVLFNGIVPKDIRGVFISGGPFGTEYKNCELVSKRRVQRVDRAIRAQRKCLYNNCTVQQLRLNRDSMRMCRAACHNDTVRMREMLSEGKSPNCHDGYKRTPLHLAACMGYTDMIKLLLDHGADPNAKDSIGNTPLHLAACTNHVKVITLLLKAGTRVSERDMAGHSPLQLAITKFNIIKRSIMPHPVLKEQVCQVITMLTEYMRRKEGSTIDPELLNKFESLVRVSDSSEEVESNIRDLLSNLSSLSLSPSTS